MITLPRRRAFLAALGVLATLLAGCATSRYDQLRSRSEKVEKKLMAEQALAVSLPQGDIVRSQRMDHLTQLKYTLSAANVGLGTVRHALPEEQRDLGYDVMEEVYSTIEWNIPLGTNEPQKPLPTEFSNGVLNLGMQKR